MNIANTNNKTNCLQEPSARFIAMFRATVGILKGVFMREIQLTQGKVALVDDDDFERLSKYKWRTWKHRNTFYAKSQKNHKTILMHREILNTPICFVSDHIDGNGLNNQKSNLRICTNAENVRHAKRYNTNTTGYKGVRVDKRYKELKFRSVIISDNKTYSLGRFLSSIDAAKAYDKKARELHKEFAITNFTEVPE